MSPEVLPVLLCNNPRVYLADYDNLVAARDRAALARMIHGRLNERYLLEMGAPPRGGSGFGSVALSCLTIETLESFWNGWGPTEGHGREAFPKFFGRPSSGLPVERAHCLKGGNRVNCSCFYHGVRCGILHRGETTGGWRVRNGDEPLFREEPDRLILNANKLRDLVQRRVDEYASKLREAEWSQQLTSPLWENFLRRMKWAVRHCSKTPLGGES